MTSPRTFLRVLAAACVASALPASQPAKAQAARAALVENVDAATRAPWAQAGTYSCSTLSPNVCYQTFTAVPAGHRRVISSVSCYFQALSTNTTSPGASFVQLYVNGNNNKSAFLQTSASPGDPTTFIANLTGLEFALEAGEVAVGEAAALPVDRVSYLLCYVNGRDVTL